MADLIERLRNEATWHHGSPAKEDTAALLEEAAAALEAAREDACVSLVADIRFACGDNGKRMQPELVEFIRELAQDAGRYRWLRDCDAEGESLIMTADGRELKTCEYLDVAIDQARGKGGGE